MRPLLSGQGPRGTSKMTNSIRLFVAVCCMTVVSSKYAFSADPTFNGAFDVLNCNVNQMVVCETDFCKPDTTDIIKGNLSIDYATMRALIGSSQDRMQSNVELTAVSEPTFGKPLWVQSRIPNAGKTLNIQTTYEPQSGGAYRLGIGVLIREGQKTSVMFGQCSAQARPKK
jgi:hypothetical protein